MESFTNSYEYPQACDIRDALSNEGYNVVISPDGTLEVHSADVHTIRLAISESEIVIDYIETESLAGGAGADCISTLKHIANESGLDVRASGVLPDAREFWEGIGFAPDGNDYLYEQEE